MSARLWPEVEDDRQSSGFGRADLALAGEAAALAFKSDHRDRVMGRMTQADPDSAKEQTQFKRFAEFTKKVISVPRAEIEERETEYKAERNKVKRHRR
ncbi:MAG: hypothetical protein ACR2FX_03840 [Chthoniobacterales bacterium]